MQNVCLLQGTKKPSVVVSKFARLSISPSEANFETKTTLGCVKTSAQNMSTAPATLSCEGGSVFARV